jgi:uncharacterized protein (TIGR03437 family)
MFYRSFFILVAFLTFKPLVIVKAADPTPHASTSGPGIIAIGSAITWHPLNAPDTFSANITFSSTPVTVDNGAVTLWQQQVPTGSSGEWDVFYMKTTNGGPIAGNVNADWNLTMDYTATAPFFFDQVVQQWVVNGTPVGPLTNGIGSICCASSSNPILPGWSYYNSGFTVTYPAGLFSDWQQIYVDPYSLVSSGGINPNTANEFIFALHLTLQSAVPTITDVISASQYGAFPTISPGDWIEIYGSNLGEIAQEWSSSDFSGVNGANAPTALGGTSVTVNGEAAFTEYVSPGQVNVQVPGGIPSGSQAVVVKTEAGSTAPFNVTVNNAQPGLLAPSSFDVNGTQYVVALFPNGVTYALPPGAVSGVAAQLPKPGDIITLYGVGFGQVNEGIPPGQVASGQSTLAAPLSVSIGGAQATVSYAGLAPGYVGLYQFNVAVPSIAATNAAPVTFSLGGVAGAQKLYLPIGN